MKLTLLSAVLLLALASQSLAGDWRVLPIKLFLDAKHLNDSVRLINNAEAPLNLQMAAFEWTQSESGEDVYTPSDELIFFPRLLTIPPGEERVLRAGIKIPPSEWEKTFRIYIEEIPEPGPKGSAAVSVAVRFGLPVFVAPLQPQAQADIENVSFGLQTAKFTVANLGNQHLMPTSLTLQGRNAQGAETFSYPIPPWYVLAGRKRSFAQKISQQECLQTNQLLIELNADNLKLSKTLAISDLNCTH